MKELQEHREMESKIEKSRTDRDSKKVHTVSPSKAPQLIEEL